MNEKRISWDQYFMEIAEIVARRSEDINHKVGSVAIRADNTIASTGYNGAPPGITIDWTNRDEKNKRVLHSELNALTRCKPNEIAKIYVTMMPCSNCILTIAAYGIKKIIYKDEYHRDDSAIQLAKEFGIQLLKYADIVKMSERGNNEQKMFQKYPSPITDTKLIEKILGCDEGQLSDIYKRQHEIEQQMHEISHPISTAPTPPGTTISTTGQPDPVPYNEFKFDKFDTSWVDCSNIGTTTPGTAINCMIAATEKEIDRLRVLQTQLDMSMKNQLLMLQSLKIQQSEVVVPIDRLSELKQVIKENPSKPYDRERLLAIARDDANTEGDTNMSKTMDKKINKLFQDSSVPTVN